MSEPSEARLSTDDHVALTALLREHFGLLFGQDARGSLERKLRERLARVGVPTFTDYVRLLRSERGAAELAEAVDLVTVNETYLLREENQLRAFADEGVVLLGAPRRVSVWSAGCSTGDEAYSIAIALLETCKIPTAGVRVVGTDVSRRCIQAARRGVFGPSAFRTVSDATRRRWFQEQGSSFAAIEEVRRCVHFSHMNLLDRARASLIGTVDAVFCRNVLIYMEPAARTRIVRTFHEMLAPGGLLLLGHSESLLHEQQRSARMTSEELGPNPGVAGLFETVHLRGEIVYRKALEQQPSRGRS